MTQWEYRIVVYKSMFGARLKRQHEDELNALGREGWELVGMAAESSAMSMVFKRPVSEKRGRRRTEGWQGW
jgi:hypothetical protein